MAQDEAPDVSKPHARGAAARRYGPALEKAYQFVLWLIPTLEKFPRGQRFLLGDRIETAALDVLEGLIEATYAREARTILARVNLLLEKLRHLVRLAKDLHYLDLRRYEFAARATDEIGRLVGGWMKAGRERDATL
jgi:23S rRNA-intervening sequence protein